MIPACKLWEKVSAKGNRYPVGRLGSVRVLVMPNTRPEREGDATHVLMFADGQPNTSSQAAPSEPSRSKATHPRAPRGGPKEQIEDDAVPF